MARWKRIGVEREGASVRGLDGMRSEENVEEMVRDVVAHMCVRSSFSVRRLRDWRAKGTRRNRY